MANPAMQKHVVKKGETLYSICKAYDLKLNDLLKANPAMAKNKTIKPGQQLVIPAMRNATMASRAAAHPVKTTMLKPAPVPATPDVKYRDEDERVNANHPLPANNAVASAVTESPITAAPETSTPAKFSVKAGSIGASDYAGLFNQYSTNGYEVAKTVGQANYLTESTSGNPYLALYNDAEVGSVIKVVNMMNKKTLYVKVIGRLSSLDSSHEIILKLSHQAAAEIGANDDRFLVEVAGVKQQAQ